MHIGFLLTVFSQIFFAHMVGAHPWWTAFLCVRAVFWWLVNCVLYPFGGIEPGGAQIHTWRWVLELVFAVASVASTVLV